MKKKFLGMSVGPLILMGLFIMIVCYTNITYLTINQLENALRGTAVATLAAYNQNSGLYMEGENGEIWKGGYNVSKSENLVDDIKNNSDMEVSFIYQDKRIMSSAKDANGNRILGSRVGKRVVEEVLNKGQEYFTGKVMIENQQYYGYYLPVKQADSNAETIGMIFVGTNKADKDLARNIMLFKIIGIIIIAVIGGIIFATFMAHSTSKALIKSIDVVKAVAVGRLDIEISAKDIRRKDEIGEIYRALLKLKKDLRELVSKLNMQATTLVTSSDGLKDMATTTTVNVRNVEEAVEHIAVGAMEHAKGVQKVSVNISEMGESILEIQEEIEVLNSKAQDMTESGDRAVVSINSLGEVNETVKQAIEKIYAQTQKTHLSSQKIKEAVKMIHAITRETDLLALNASIEAARAGEEGRGFAVVAAQIQKLANESNQSSNQIADIIEELNLDADSAVEIMNQVKEIISEQSREIIIADNMFGAVKQNIENVSYGMQQIREHTGDMEQRRKEIGEVVENLTAIAEEDAASTEETSSSTIEVATAMDRVSLEAKELKQIADQIAESLKIFKL